MNVELRRIIVFLICSTLVLCCNGHLTDGKDVGDGGADPNLSLLPEDTNEVIEKATQKIEELALAAKKALKVGLLEDFDVYYNEMAHILDDIIDGVTNSYAYQFLNAKGLKRIVSPNLAINHAKLRTKLLSLLKILFDVAPVTTNSLIPNRIAIILLDIFEKDDSVSIKVHALDILYKWLPNNPKLQTRVMKDKGLEPFYMNINKLDISVIQTLLELFNTILKEHVIARSEKAQINKLDYNRQILYQRIGLFERMESSDLCNGLVGKLQVVWDNNNNDEMVKTILELTKNTKPFCGNNLKENTEALAFLEILLKFVKNEDKKYFENMGLNATEFESVFEDYVSEMKTVKDEL